MKLHNFKNNVDDMLTEIKKGYGKIRNMNSSCESVLRYTLMVLHSDPYKDYNLLIKCIKSDMDSCVGLYAKIPFNQLAVAARNKYLNQKAAGEYVKVDPRHRS